MIMSYLTKEQCLALDINVYNMAIEKQWQIDKVKKNLSGDLKICENCGRKYSFFCICPASEEKWENVLNEVREVTKQRQDEEKEKKLTFERTWKDVKETLPQESGRYWVIVEQQNDLGKSHYQTNCYYNSFYNTWCDSFAYFNVIYWTELAPIP